MPQQPPARRWHQLNSIQAIHHCHCDHMLSSATSCTYFWATAHHRCTQRSAKQQTHVSSGLQCTVSPAPAMPLPGTCAHDGAHRCNPSCSHIHAAGILRSSAPASFRARWEVGGLAILVQEQHMQPVTPPAVHAILLVQQPRLVTQLAFSDGSGHMCHEHKWEPMMPSLLSTRPESADQSWLSSALCSPSQTPALCRGVAGMLVRSHREPGSRRPSARSRARGATRAPPAAASGPSAPPRRST